MNEARKPLRIGLLGAARIAPSAIIFPAQATGHELSAVAARDINRAKDFAKQYQIKKTYGSYQELIDDPEIDVVYNALHNGGHAPWNMRALAAGKNVLSEKPSASNAAEAQEVINAVEKSKKVFMEGFHYFYHPVFQKALATIKSGEIGEITKVESSLLIPPPVDGDLRWSFELAGGSAMDVGCYSIHSQRMICKALTGAEPTVESATANTREKDVDSKMSLVLKYPNGVTGFAHGSFEQKEMIAPLTITGTKGSIHIPNFVVTGWDDRIIIESNGKKRTEHLGSLSTYTYQLMSLADRIDLGKQLQTDEQDAYATMKVIDAGYTKSGLPLRPTFKIA